MLNPVRTANFKRDVSRLQRRGKDIEKLKRIIGLLVDESLLPRNFKDHPLRGEFTGYRDCHIESDWVLIYAVRGSDLILYRTGTHADVLE